MDEIQKRLSETSEACIKSYEAWRKDQKDGSVRETLMEAVHELRKVAARLEIEIAISERDEMAAKPIPIPPHRSSRKKGNNNHHDDNIGNVPEQSGGGNKGPRQSRKRSSGGGKKSSN